MSSITELTLATLSSSSSGSNDGWSNSTSISGYGSSNSTSLVATAVVFEVCPGSITTRAVLVTDFFFYQTLGQENLSLIELYIEELFGNPL